MLDIADNQVAQPLIVDGLPLVIDDKIVTTVDGPAVQHAKLRVDTRKWAASKLKPKRYGDKVTTEHTGPNGGPVHVIGTEMTADEATKLYKDIIDD